jgi:hypothetical protein
VRRFVSFQEQRNFAGDGLDQAPFLGKKRLLEGEPGPQAIADLHGAARYTADNDGFALAEDRLLGPIGRKRLPIQCDARD